MKTGKIKRVRRYDPEKPLLSKALGYWQMGLSIIPLRQRDKIPLIKYRKYKTERASFEQIIEWWSKWPDANIGVLTGKVSNLIVVDFDSWEVLKSFEKNICKLPKTIKQTTARGIHFFFKYNPDLRYKPGQPPALPGQDCG